jgi:HSP20 family protein
MSNLIINKSGALIPPLDFQDPMQLFRQVIHWNPLRELVSSPVVPQYWPAFEVKETAEAFVVKADLPGVKEKDLELQITGNRLAITGTRAEEKDVDADAYFTHERTFGTFTRTFGLPEGIDENGIHAEIANGVLNVVVPKLAEMKTRKIQIGVPGKTRA